MGELRNTITAAMNGPFGIPASGGPLPPQGEQQPAPMPPQGGPGGDPMQAVQQSAMALMSALKEMGVDQAQATQMLQALVTGQIPMEQVPPQLQQQAQAFVEAAGAMAPQGGPAPGGQPPPPAPMPPMPQQ